MKITLNDGEIEEALISYIGTQGIDIQDKDIEVNFTAGRKDGNGNTASIDIKAKLHASSSKETETTKLAPKDPDSKPKTEAKGIDPKESVFG